MRMILHGNYSQHNRLQIEFEFCFFFFESFINNVWTNIGFDRIGYSILDEIWSIFVLKWVIKTGMMIDWLILLKINCAKNVYALKLNGNWSISIGRHKPGNYN